MIVRIAFFCIAFVSLCTIASAQNDPERLRFKHEKHGAIVFARGDDYEIKCDIYQPVCDEPRPVMLAIHGGAWTTGTKFAMFRHARILANRGYVVMAINYRLAPKYKWPAQIHDCKHAVRWIRENAEKYNADPSRVYAFGYSAGGHLAAMLATTDEDDGFEGDVVEPWSKHSSRIQGMIAGGAPAEFSWIGEEDTTIEYWLGNTKMANPKVYAEASPTTFVTKDDPVMVLFHGTSDALVPVSSPGCLLEKCRESNVEAELLLCSGGHAAVFTFTTNFLDSLERFESMSDEKRCREKIAALREMVNLYIKERRHLPESNAELGQFAVEMGKIEATAIEDFLLNERDGKQFEISRSSKDGVIISEAIGVDGEILSSRK